VYPASWRYRPFGKFFFHHWSDKKGGQQNGETSELVSEKSPMNESNNLQDGSENTKTLRGNAEKDHHDIRERK